MLYIIHIPKTAGVSLQNFLRSQVYGDRLHTIYHDLGYWNAAEERAKLTGREVFYGHFCYGLHRLMHDPQPSYITMLRHPVERVRSLYKYIKRRPDAGRPYELIHEGNLSLREFVEAGICIESNNHYTKMLAANYARVYRWLHHSANFYASISRGGRFIRCTAGGICGGRSGTCAGVSSSSASRKISRPAWTIFCV